MGDIIYNRRDDKKTIQFYKVLNFSSLYFILCFVLSFVRLDEHLWSLTRVVLPLPLPRGPTDRGGVHRTPEVLHRNSSVGNRLHPQTTHTVTDWSQDP